MNAARLLTHFDRISEAPDAVPQLRRFILDLAVRGQLVEQDPKDEPASILRIRIAAHTERRTASGDFSEPRNAIELPIETLPFTVPWTWEWARLIELAEVSYGFAFESARFNGSNTGMPLIRIRDISGTDTEAYYDGPFDAFYSVAAGDYLVGMDGDFNVRRWRGPAALLNQRVMRIRAWQSDVVPEFLVIPLQILLHHLHGSTSQTTVKHLSAKQVNGIRLPLPPVAEQQRIVAKIDELMALCDRLEAALAERETLRDRVVAASLNRLNEPAADDAEPLRAHARFHLRHIPRLTTRPEHIRQLRQTIVTFAVRGRLVPQDPSDEPASVLLKCINADKLKRAADGRLRGETAVEPLDSNDAPFLVPASWCWALFGQITICRDGERVPVSQEERRGRAKRYDYYGASGVIDKIDAYLFDKPLLLIGEDGANLINRSTPIAFMARGKYWVNNHAHVLDGVSEGFLRYLELHMNAIDLTPYVTGTAQPKMNQKKMNSIPIAVPPLAEQHRIVTRVNELMALCDGLEAQLATAQTETRRLLEAVLHQALNPVA
jgi:type I restriction enzyme S subunit